MRPPPVLLLILSFEAGLATGLAHFPAPAFGIPILAILALVLRGRPGAWLPWVTAVGLALGAIGRARSQLQCAALLPAAEVRLTVRLREPVDDGIASARPESSCLGDIAVRVRGARLLRAGTRWRVTGRWIPLPRFGGRPDGILVARDVDPEPSRPGPSERLRSWLAGTTAALYGSRAGLVEALLVGRRGGIDPAINAAFARSGLVHLLSISGFHVGIVFVWTILLLRLFGIRRGPAKLSATVLVFLYVAFLGWPAPAARAALLCGVGVWCTWRQRQPGAAPLLAVTCLLVSLLDPWALFDLGGWLSAAAFGGAVLFSRWSDRFVGDHPFWRMLFGSLGATLATAPITALAFGAVALAGVVLNFVAIPLAAIAVPAVLASVAVTPLARPAAAALAAGGGLGLAGLEALARLGSALPIGAVISTPGPGAALPWVGLLASALWALGRRNTSRRAALRVGWLVGIVGVFTAAPFRRPLSADDGSGLTLHFLSVGQGDAAVIHTPAGRWILIDAGPADDKHDAGRDVVLPFLVRHGVRRLAAFVLSHAHQDHVGGAESVLRQIPVDLIVEPAEPVEEPHYLHVLDLAAIRGYRWHPGRAGDSLTVDGVRVLVVHPDTTWARWGDDLNDDSVVLLVRYGAFEGVLAGDLGIKAESLLAGHIGRVDLLKVGHHGSAGSSGIPWLRELRPKVAVVSVGPNRYGHPSPAAMQRLAARGVEVWRTDRDGSVTVTVGDSTMTVRGRRGTRTFALRP